MSGSVSGAASLNIQSIFNRGAEDAACATGRAAFIGLVSQGANDPIAMFKQAPHQTNNAKELVYHEAQKNLPADFRSKGLSAEGDKIRNLIGVIYSDIKNSGNQKDIATLDAVCKQLGDAKGSEKKEQAVQHKLSDLVSKYGAEAFEKVINQYIGHCMEAWYAHHQSKSVDVQDKVIFKQCLDVCKSTLKDDVAGLVKPNQPMETLAQQMNFFVHDCAAISKTLTFYDAPPVNIPAADTPDSLNVEPEDGANNQRFIIPTGPGQGGITLNINNAGGTTTSNSSSNTATSGPADSNSAIVKHILESGLRDVDKVDLINNFFKLNAGDGAGNFLNNLAGVQGFKQEQTYAAPLWSVDKREMAIQTYEQDFGPAPTVQQQGEESSALAEEMPVRFTPVTSEKLIQGAESDDPSSKNTKQMQVSQEDNLDDVKLRGDRAESGRTPAAGSTPVYTTSRTFDIFNRRNSTSTDFVPTDSEVKPNKPGEKNVTLESKFEALKKSDASAFEHLEKKGADTTQSIPVKQATEQKPEELVATSLMESDHEPKWQLPENTYRSTAAGPQLIQQPATSAVDNLDGVTLRKSGERPGRKSSVDNFQPANFASNPVSNTGTRTADRRVYTTHRTVDFWNRNSTQLKHFVPDNDETTTDELKSKFAGMEQRGMPDLENLENKTVNQQKPPLPFQEKLAEFRNKREAAGKKP